MKNQFEGIVRDISLKGLGVVDHPDGKIYFVRGVWVGDMGVFEVYKEEKKYGFAKLVYLKQLSDQRRDSVCPHLGFDSKSCGGCPWMIATYEAQIKMKQKHILESLTRSGVVGNDTKILNIQPSKNEFGYRNRARVKSHKGSVGYYSPETHNLVDIEDCIVLNSKTREQLFDLRKKVKNQIDHEEVFYDLSSEDQEIPKANVSKPFRQGNDDQNLYMKEWVRNQILNADYQGQLVELFCGSGNFTEVLSEGNFKSIISIESNEKAINELKNKKIKNTIGLVANLFFKKNWNIFLEKTKSSEVLFIDPPREGFEGIHDFLNLHKKIHTMIYISCDLYTFNRDAKKALSLGYHLKLLQPVDQFPQTPHVELLSVFKK